MTQAEQDQLVLYKLEEIRRDQQRQGEQLQTLDERTTAIRIDVTRLQERGGWSRTLAVAIGTGLLLMGGLVAAFAKGVIGL